MRPNYEPSGSFDLQFLLLAVVAMAGAAGLGWLYQWLIGVMPLVILSLALTAGFAAALFFGMGFCVQFGHSRNPWLSAVVGVAVGLVGLAASYWFDYQAAIDAVLQQDGLAAEMRGTLQSKFGFFDWIDMRVEQGYEITRRGSNGLPLTGIFVYLIWGIEALVVTGAAGMGAYGAATIPYCESCGEWCDEETLQMYPNPAEVVVQKIEMASEIDQVVEPDVQFGNQENRSLKYEVEECPSCDDSSYLTVSTLRVTTDSDGDEEVEEHPIWYELEVEAETVERVATLERRLADAIEAGNAEPAGDPRREVRPDGP